jgi:hypothetical protein
VPADVLRSLSPLKGKVLERREYNAEIEKLLGGADKANKRFWSPIRERRLPEAKPIPGPKTGFWANGSLGQVLIVLTKPRLVVVRMTRGPDTETSDDGVLKHYAPRDLPELVDALAR